MSQIKLNGCMKQTYLTLSLTHMFVLSDQDLQVLYCKYKLREETVSIL